jgi:hypothetical protein
VIYTFSESGTNKYSVAWSTANDWILSTNADIMCEIRGTIVADGDRFTGQLLRGVIANHSLALQRLVVEGKMSDDLKTIEGTVTAQETTNKGKAATKLLAQAPGSTGAARFTLYRTR